jgi:hypothetical protein
MPLYDFHCDAGHRFERVVPLAQRNEPIACEGGPPKSGDAGAARLPCPLPANRVEIAHARPSTMLDYGLGANRDAAREGRYDPNRPSTRGVRKVQL